jgi:GPH family glycoside/pentoside/hexuronide:cation symporter
MSGGLASTWTLINAMIPDVVDLNELKTGERREGMFSAVYSWTYKMGVALALIIAGYILNWSGFDAALGADQAPDAILKIRLFFTGIPVVSISLALMLLSLYKISEKRSYEIRSELELLRVKRAGVEID